MCWGELILEKEKKKIIGNVRDHRTRVFYNLVVPFECLDNGYSYKLTKKHIMEWVQASSIQNRWTFCCLVINLRIIFDEEFQAMAVNKTNTGSISRSSTDTSCIGFYPIFFNLLWIFILLVFLNPYTCSLTLPNLFAVVVTTTT